MKKLLSVLLVLALVILPVNQAMAFSDVENHWAEKHIEWADGAGYVKGYEDETFKPEGDITIAEFYTIVNRLISNDDMAKVDFADVATDAWYKEEVEKAVANGYIENSSTDLKADEAITRDEVARIIAKVYKLEGKEDGVSKFADADSIKNKAAVGVLVEKEILHGDETGIYRPEDGITRAETAKVFHTLCRKFGTPDLFLKSYVEDLVILHSNDVHGNVQLDDKHIGYATYKNVIDAIKKDHKKVLVIDAGDASQGSNFASLNDGADVITVLNMLDLNAFAPGNHEFDYSLEAALENYKNSDFKWYASNVFDEKTGELVFSGGEVIDVDGLKVGLFGLATPETKYKADPRNTEGLKFVDTVEENAKIAQAEVDKLKGEGAEVVVLISHLGDDEASVVKSTDMAEKVKGITVIVDGHSHTLHAKGKEVGNSFLVSTGDTLKNIGFTTISKDGKVKSRMITRSEAVCYGENAEIKGKIDGLLVEQDKVLGEVLGKTATKLDGEREQVRTGETNLGNLITDAMKKEVEADVVITNGGGIRASIEAGDVTVGNVFTVLPFGNAMTVIEVTGQDIIDALNHGVKDYPKAAGQFPHVSGISFEIVEGAPSTVQNVKVGEEDIDPAKTYKLATNDFMAVGGDGYEMFKGKNQLALYGSLAKIVEEYITELSKDGEFTYEINERIVKAEAKAEEKPEEKAEEKAEEKKEEKAEEKKEEKTEEKKGAKLNNGLLAA